MEPSDCGTLADWAKRVCDDREVVGVVADPKIGLTFDRWRQQLHLVVVVWELASGVTVKSVAAELGYEPANAFKSLGYTPALLFLPAPPNREPKRDGGSVAWHQRFGNRHFQDLLLVRFAGGDVGSPANVS